MIDTHPNIRLHELWGPGRPRAGEAAVCEILRQAIRLFGRRGYGGTSMRTIASQAKVTAPLIGYHFGSKEGLFEASAHVVLSSTSEMMHVATANGRIVDLVREFAAGHVEFARDHPDALRFILTVVYGPEESQPPIDVMAYWRPVVIELVDRFERALRVHEFDARSGATAPRLVRHLMNLVHMEIMSAYEEERFVSRDPEMLALFREDTRDLVDDLVLQFFHGAGGHRVDPSEERDS